MYDYRHEKRLQLDLGCGSNKQPGFLGMDVRDVEGVDILHDIEDFPWPLESGSCLTIVASHIVEHIKPWYSVDFMDECWRCLELGGKLLIATPYPGSRGFWQDPTHCNGWNEATFQYFDPNYPLYYLYNPKPWKIEKGFPVYQVQGNLEVVLVKIPDGSGEALKSVVMGEDLGITVADQAGVGERVG